MFLETVLLKRIDCMMKHREMYKWRTCSLYTYKSFMLKLWNIQQLLNYTLMKTSLIVLSYTQNLYDFSLKVRRMMSWSLFLLWIFLKLVLEVTASESNVIFLFFGLYNFIDRKRNERGATCSKVPQVGVKPWAAAARTGPLFIGCVLNHQDVDFTSSKSSFSIIHAAS